MMKVLFKNKITNQIFLLSKCKISRVTLCAGITNSPILWSHLSPPVVTQSGHLCFILAFTQSSACPRLARTFVDGNSYTFDNYRGSRLPCRGQTNGTLALHRVLSSSQPLGNRRRRHRPHEIHFSSRNCGRFVCAAEIKRETGRSSPSADYSRGRTDIPMDFFQEDVSVRLSIFCGIFCSWRGRFGTKPGEF